MTSGLLEYANLSGRTYAYELEIDVQIRAAGVSGTVYVNSQMIYIENLSGDIAFRGNSVQQTQAIDLSTAKALDVKWKWDDNSPDKIITNKMVVITKTY